LSDLKHAKNYRMEWLKNGIFMVKEGKGDCDPLNISGTRFFQGLLAGTSQKNEGGEPPNETVSQRWETNRESEKKRFI